MNATNILKHTIAIKEKYNRQNSVFHPVFLEDDNRSLRNANVTSFDHENCWKNINLLRSEIEQNVVEVANFYTFYGMFARLMSFLVVVQIMDLLYQISTYNIRRAC